MRSFSLPTRPSSVLRSLAALLTASLVLSGCLASTPMARSSVATPTRPLYSDEDGAEVVALPTEEAPPPVTPPPEDVLEEDRREAEERVPLDEYATGMSGGGTSGGAGGDASGGEGRERRVEPAAAPTVVELSGATTTEAIDQSADVEVSRTASTGASTAYVPPPNIGSSVAVEPLPWVPLDPAPVPAGPRRVLLATMEVPPGRTIFPPVSACQDVLVYVQEGALEAMGTGVGITDAPASLYAGDAVRFGPEGDGRLTNRSGSPARALVVIARAASAGAPLYTAPVDAGLCELVVNTDPVVRPSRLASTATTAPLVVMDGHLAVRILLDLDGTAAAHAGLAVLEGDEEMRVDAHAHDEADEVLYVERGEGVMTVGDQRIDVEAGSVLYIPHGVTHAFEPSGSEPFVAVQLYAPSGPEQRFRGLAAP